MPRQNRQKESPELISDSEIWFAIRYLDPDLRPKPSQNTAYIAVTMVVVLLWLIWYSLKLCHKSFRQDGKRSALRLYRRTHESEQ